MNWRYILLLCILSLNRDGYVKEKYDPSTLVFPPYLHTYGIRKATRFHLFMFTRNKTSFENPQGLAVVRLKAWEDTTSIHDDDEVTVYGVNSGENNIIYNKSMKTLGIYGLKEQGEQRLNNPHGIAANARGDVYVADTGNHRIVRLFNPGRELKFICSIGTNGPGAGAFKAPSGVALDAQGNIYVTDTENNRIQIFNSKNQFQQELGQRSNPKCLLLQPTGIVVSHSDEEWNFFKKKFLVVIDSSRQRLQKLSFSGKLLGKVNMEEMGFPNADLQYLDLDYYGNVYVTDIANHCIHKFNRRLGYLAKYGRLGSGDKEFIEPRGITIYRRFGQILIAEKMGAQYYWIGVDVFDFKAQYESQRNLLKVDFFLTEPAYVTAEIFDEFGILVTKMFEKRFMMSGTHADRWAAKIYLSGTTKKSIYSNLKFLPAGKYILKYNFEPTYSSYHYFSKLFEEKFVISGKGK